MGFGGCNEQLFTENTQLAGVHVKCVCVCVCVCVRASVFVCESYNVILTICV